MSVFLTPPSKYSKPRKAHPYHVWRDSVSHPSAKAVRAPGDSDVQFTQGCFHTPSRKTSDEC